jgi:hypothetical protein
LNEINFHRLGHGILWCSDPNACYPALEGRTRFLDNLWLPTALAELTPDQILVINRYRESVIDAEGQYEYARRARRILVEAIKNTQPTALVEIGCGKFPIDTNCERYLGVDIDPEAIAFLQGQGRNACDPSALVASVAWPIDCIVSAYAMHFPIGDGLLRDLNLVASSDAVFCFNMIVEESLSPLRLLARLSPAWPLVHVIKTPCMARREFFFVAGRSSACRRMIAAVEALRNCETNNVVRSATPNFSPPDGVSRGA